MVREVSSNTLQEILKENTSLVFLECLTFEHPDLQETIRLVNDYNEPLARSAGVFDPFPFKVTPPDDTRDQMPSVTVVVDAVDRQLLLALRALTSMSKPTVTYEVVVANAPDTVEYGPLPLTLDGWDVDRTMRMSMTLSFHRNLLSAPFPAGRMTPSNAKDV